MSRMRPPPLAVAAPTLDHEPAGTFAAERPAPLLERVALQVANRFGVAGLLLLLGAVGAAVTGRDHRTLLLAAFVLADLSFPAAVLARWQIRRHNRRGWESFGLVIFTGVVALSAATLLVLSTLRVFPK